MLSEKSQTLMCTWFYVVVFLRACQVCFHSAQVGANLFFGTLHLNFQSRVVCSWATHAQTYQAPWRKTERGERESKSRSTSLWAICYKTMLIILIHSSPKMNKKLKILSRVNISLNTYLYWCLVCSKTIPLLSWFLFCDFWLFRENAWWLIIRHLSSQTSYRISRSENKY